mmetsp:Transcript_37082/g.75258  ORF Transcript_37082/g.75258 Transcript_37082/m.75258 type:complete len:80 (+) Transcript_37082:877-1116(+)
MQGTWRAQKHLWMAFVQQRSGYQEIEKEQGREKRLSSLHQNIDINYMRWKGGEAVEGYEFIKSITLHVKNNILVENLQL